MPPSNGRTSEGSAWAGRYLRPHEGRSSRVRWSAENDKIGFEHVTPLTAEAVTALKAACKASASIGDAWVFESPVEAGQPASRFLLPE